MGEFQGDKGMPQISGATERGMTVRSKGYKCNNVKCGSCVAHCLCGEPTDIALGCADRMINVETNADRIRAMSDEELLHWLLRLQDDAIKRFANFELPNYQSLADWLKQPADGGAE